MRDEGDNLPGDPRTASTKTALMRTIEAAARRWYPSGVPRALFERVIAEALAEAAQSAQAEGGAATVTDGLLIDQAQEYAEPATTTTPPEPQTPRESRLRAHCIVPGPLSEEEESLLFRAVTQGLRWRWEDVAVIVRDDLSRIKTGVPIVAFGVPEVLASLGGSVDHVRVREGYVRWSGGDLIETVSLADALTSREAKRQLWSHLQILLAVVNE